MNANPTASPAGDILVVDDTVANLKLLANILSEAGYQVRPAADGELALRSVQARQPALILLDIRMPGMDGFEVCRRLKADEHTREIPVIFLSSLTDTADKTHGFELGAVDYIDKPYHAQEVLARIKTHLALSEAKQQLRTQNLQLHQANEQLMHEVAERKRAEAALEAALAQLRALSERITKGQEEERFKVAYELHEQLGQDVATLNVYLTLFKDYCRGEDAKTRFEEARTIVDSMMKRIRRLSLELRPPQLDVLGLDIALHEHCRRQAEGAGWALHFDGSQNKGKPCSDVETVCFRLAQEALANAARHAGATEVWVSLEQGENELCLSVRDNGVGFDVGAIQGGAQTAYLGLLGMKERARHVGGRVELESSPGNGTEIRAIFPHPAPPS